MNFVNLFFCFFVSIGGESVGVGGRFFENGVVE
jgi:hypothetical protein